MNTSHSPKGMLVALFVISLVLTLVLFDSTWFGTVVSSNQTKAIELVDEIKQTAQKVDGLDGSFIIKTTSELSEVIQNRSLISTNVLSIACLLALSVSMCLLLSLMVKHQRRTEYIGKGIANYPVNQGITRTGLQFVSNI